MRRNVPEERTPLIARAFAIGVLFLSFGMPANVFADPGAWEVSGRVGAEVRVFPNDPALSNQDGTRAQPSLFAQPRIDYEWGGGANRLTLEPFVRLDREDSNRTQADLREAHGLHAAADWDLVLGFQKVFWGVAESRHLVDIINQTDAVEDVDGEDKLGQPMINLNLDRDWGRVPRS